ncbi:MAG: carbohydrate binding family 9 domain-containing protein [Acidobacteriota bacterium]|nr:carbohydrate binding family 9 domain-containing protein [Acidobacteriota bacterium]
MLCAHCGAQEGKPTAVSIEAPKEQKRSDVHVPLLDQPLRLADFEGMQPRAELRGKVAEIAGFIQNQPRDGQPPTERTEVWLGRTKAALYVVFVCHDHRPSDIRGHLARRENILNDDTVSLLLDPFQDRRRGVLFSVNAAGVQADAEWTDNHGPDYSYDTVWDSDGRTTRDGWLALIAIPFRSLRFREAGSDWGVVLSRNFPRNSETDYWPRVSANVSGTLSQEGTLRGIEGVTGSHNVQINPYVLGQNEKTLLNLDPLNPFFSSRKFEGTEGGEVKAILKDAIVFDATVNPDFSDVESDQPQFTVNQRYPVFFPELRPFFLENANYFSTPITLVYTRNIVRPEFGARATGKIGRTNLGFLAIDDREPGETFGASDPEHGKRAAFAVGRISQDLGKGSSVGVIYTDEEFAGGWNRIGGVDFSARLGDHWTVLGQGAESSTKGASDAHGAGSYLAGPENYLEVTRDGHAFRLDSTNKDISTGFRSQVGFIQTANIRSDETHANYRWFPKHSVLQSFGLETNQQIAFDHQGNRVYHYSSFDPIFLLPRGFLIAAVGGQNSDTVGPQNGYALAHSVNFTENYGVLVLRGAPFSQLNFNIQAVRGGNVNYNPVAGATPALMDQQNVQALFTVQPLRQLTMDNTYLLDRDRSVRDGALVYESQTIRTKMNYQFTRAFSARMIVEYDSTLANPAETSLRRTKQVQTQALLTWLPHPGTAIYVGYNNDIQNYNHTLCSRLGGTCDPTQPILPRGTGLLNDGRQFFVKASYLLRF